MKGMTEEGNQKRLAGGLEDVHRRRFLWLIQLADKLCAPLLMTMILLYIRFHHVFSSESPRTTSWPKIRDIST